MFIYAPLSGDAGPHNTRTLLGLPASTLSIAEEWDSAAIMN